MLGGNFLKLVLFQTSPDGDVLPGLLTDRGVADITAAVPRNYTPQLVMQGIIDDFDKWRPALEKRRGKALRCPLDRRYTSAATLTAARQILAASQTMGTRNENRALSICS